MLKYGGKAEAEWIPLTHTGKAGLRGNFHPSAGQNFFSILLSNHRIIQNLEKNKKINKRTVKSHLNSFSIFRRSPVAIAMHSALRVRRKVLPASTMSIYLVYKLYSAIYM